MHWSGGAPTPGHEDSPIVYIYSLHDSHDEHVYNCMTCNSPSLSFLANHHQLTINPKEKIPDPKLPPERALL
jgi:hypothetical protein